MKQWIITLLVFMASFQAAAATSPSTSASKTAEISEQDLAKVLRLYQSIAELSVDFKQTKTFKDIPTPIQSEGELKLVRPDLVIWSVKKPSIVSVKLSRDEIQITSGSGTDATVQSFKRDQIPQGKDRQSLQSLVSWLNLDPKTLTKEYAIQETGPKAYAFRPRQPDAVPFGSLEMNLTNSGHLRKLVIHEKSGDQMEINFGTPKIKSKP